MRQLRSARVLHLRGIRGIPVTRLEQLIRSSGYFRQKSARLKNFVTFLDQTYAGSLTRMFAQPTPVLRGQLLALNGVGPETADSILLYAGQHSVFVVDAYTKRIAARHGILPADAAYEDVRELFERALTNAEVAHEPSPSRFGAAAHPSSRMSLTKRAPLAQIYNEMHGLLVGVGKKYCLNSVAKCEECPLKPLLRSSS